MTAAAGVASQPDTYYFGATDGGVYKTADGGLTWLPITDQWIRTGSVGAIAVAPSDPNVLYLGMGESPVRGNVSHGDGMYKSVDVGKTWTHIGLGDSRQISRIRGHPTNADIAYVAAMGHLFGPNAERGIFKTVDGGRTWRRVLYRDVDTAAIDLILDPNNPRVVYAALWQVRCTPWSFDRGGPGSGLFKSTDEGETWTEITRNEGLPKGVIGKIGVTVSPVDSNRVYAIIEADEGGVFRSDDGGRTYTVIGTPHSDNHDLWMAPDNNQRMVEGNDGGANVSLNGGQSWTAQNQATAQFDRVTTDNDFPYNIHGAQQDNTTVRFASRTTSYGITERHWWPVGGGESGWIAPDPRARATDAAFEKQFTLLMQIRDKLTETRDGILRIRDVRTQPQHFSKRQKGEKAAADTVLAAVALARKLTAIEEALYQTKNKSAQDPLNYPIQLNNKLAALAGVVGSADHPHTDQSYVVYEDLVTRINAQLQALKVAIDSDLAKCNDLARKAALPAILPVAIAP